MKQNSSQNCELGIRHTKKRGEKSSLLLLIKFDCVSNNKTNFKSSVLNESLLSVIASAEPLWGGSRSEDSIAQ